MSNKNRNSTANEQSHEASISAGVEALHAEDDPGHGTRKHQSGDCAKAKNLYAGLAYADQVALGVVPAVSHGRDPAGRLTINLEVTEDRLNRFLDMAPGQNAVLHVTCLGTDGDWQRVQVRKVIWNALCT